MVDDDGVSMPGDKAIEGVEFAAVCGEDLGLVVVEGGIEGGDGKAGRWLEGRVDSAKGLKD